MTRQEEIKKRLFEISTSNFNNSIVDSIAYFVGYVDAVEWADAHPHWISVKDELPPKKNEYDDLSINVLATDGKEIYESIYNHDSKDWFTHDMWGLDNISYWMYLPSVDHLKDK